MSTYMKSYWIWTAVFAVAWVWLFCFTDLQINWAQCGLAVLALSSHGAAQRNYGRWDRGNH